MTDRWTGPLVGAAALALAAGALWFISTGMGGLADNLVYYWSPTELVDAGDKAVDATIRLGGMVEHGSKDWDPDNQLLDFRITDGRTSVSVHCTGAPPQMFREGIGVVVEGNWQSDGVFHTDRVMIKHSNEYRAPEDGELPSDMFGTLEEES